MHVSPAKDSYVWLLRKCDYRTARETDKWTDRRQTKWSLWNIAMHDYQESVTTRQTDTQTDRKTDTGQNDPNVPLYFAGVLKNVTHSYAWLPRKCDYGTDRHMDGQTDPGQSDPFVLLCFACIIKNATHSYALLPRKCDYWTDRHTDGQTDRCRTKLSLCSPMLCRRHKKYFYLFSNGW